MDRVLVLPDRTIRHCPDSASVPASEFGYQLAGNLRQLLGIDKVGPGRKRRYEAERRWTPSLITAGAVATIISDAMTAKSTASATATLLLQHHKVGDGAARSI